MSKGRRLEGFKRRVILQSQGYKLDPEGNLIHRIVCKQAHGNYPKHWVVHHIDENKQNNLAENLIAMPRRVHEGIHKACKEQRVIFTRKNIEDMIKAYVNIDKNKHQHVNITIVVNSGQIKYQDIPKVTAKVVPKSISSEYR